MKREILLILCICFFVPVVVDAQGLDRTEMEWKKGIDRESRTVEFFEKLTAGALHQQFRFKSVNTFLLERVESQFWLESSFIPAARFDFSYQDALRTETTSWFSNFDEPVEWSPDQRTLYDYQNNMLTSVLEQFYEVDEYLNEFRTLFTYQQIGGNTMIETDIEQFWDEEEETWVNGVRGRFIPENETIVRLEEDIWDGEEWILRDRTLISEEGGDLIFLYQENFDGEWENDFRDIYPNTTFLELYEVFLDFFINPFEMGTMLPFFERFPDFTEQSWDGDDWVNDFRFTSINNYDSSTGQLTERVVLEEEFFDSEWFTLSEAKIEYEDNRAITLTLSEENFFENDGELVPSFKEEFEYNDEGLLSIVLQYSYDESDENNGEYEEMLTNRVVLSYSGIVTSAERNVLPETFNLGNAYPNPFNPSSVVPFQTNHTGPISIKVYDMLGRYVATLADGIYQAGSHTVRFEASGLSSGVYLIRMQSQDNQQVRRVTLLK